MCPLHIVLVLDLLNPAREVAKLQGTEGSFSRSTEQEKGQLQLG